MITLRPLSLGLASLALVALAGCSSEREMGFQQVEIDEYQRQIKELEDQLYDKDSKGVKASLASGGGAASTENIQNAVGPKVDVRTEKVAVRMSVPGEVLFKSGSAQLSAEAKSTLNKIIAVIREQFPGYEIRVVGHTDDQKITRSHDRWEDNWDLSAGRAHQVLLYLQGRGLDVKLLGIEGFGQERPLVPNTSASNRQKNRRVEIVAIPPAGRAQALAPSRASGAGCLRCACVGRSAA